MTVVPNCIRPDLRNGRGPRAGSISRLLRDDRQGNRLHLTDAGRTTAVYGQFVHRRSGGEAVKAICVFDGDGNEGPSSLARSRHRLAWADLVGSR